MVPDGVVAGPRALRHRVEVAVDQEGVLLGRALAGLHLGDHVLDVPVQMRQIHDYKVHMHSISGQVGLSFKMFRFFAVLLISNHL